MAEGSAENGHPNGLKGVVLHIFGYTEFNAVMTHHIQAGLQSGIQESACKVNCDGVVPGGPTEDQAMPLEYVMIVIAALVGSLVSGPGGFGGYFIVVIALTPVVGAKAMIPSIMVCAVCANLT